MYSFGFGLQHLQAIVLDFFINHLLFATECLVTISTKNPEAVLLNPKLYLFAIQNCNESKSWPVLQSKESWMKNPSILPLLTLSIDNIFFQHNQFLVSYINLNYCEGPQSCWMLYISNHPRTNRLFSHRSRRDSRQQFQPSKAPQKPWKHHPRSLKNFYLKRIYIKIS